MDLKMIESRLKNIESWKIALFGVFSYIAGDITLHARLATEYYHTNPNEYLLINFMNLLQSAITPTLVALAVILCSLLYLKETRILGAIFSEILCFYLLVLSLLAAPEYLISSFSFFCAGIWGILSIWEKWKNR